MITNATIEAVLSERLATIASLPPVYWPNAAADPADGQPNILANLSVTKRPVDNVCTEIKGVLKLAIRFPIDRADEAEAMGAAVEAAFPATGAIGLGQGVVTDWCCAGGLWVSGQWAVVAVSLAVSWIGD